MTPNHASTGSILNKALKHHQAGQLAEAAASYQAILQQNPSHSDALHLLGVVAQQLNKLDMAIALMKAAIVQRPAVAHYHHNLGNTYLKDGQTNEAINGYLQAVKLKPDYFEAHNGLGNTLASLNQWEIAAEAYQYAIQLQPSFAEAHYNLARVLAKLNKIEPAISSYRKAIYLDSQHHEYSFNLGGLLLKKEDYSEAIECYKAALTLNPQDPECLSNLGLAYVGINDLERAINSYRRAILIDPNYAGAHNNLAISLFKQRRFSEAEEACLRAIAINPSFAEAQYNLGNALREQNRRVEAIAAYKKAIALSSGNDASNPGSSDESLRDVHWQASNNLACTLDELGDTAAALECHKQAIAHNPENPTLHWNRGLILLMNGNFSEGWEEYEWRWKRKDFPTKPRNMDCPIWRGESLHGARILLHAEQGFGDTLQFVRYAPLVTQRGGQVILEIQPALRPLIETMPGVSRVIAQGETLPDVSWHCPLMSLPLAFHTTGESIPAFPSYLQVSKTKIAAAKERWSGSGFRVGIAWAGNPSHVQDPYRSMKLHDFMPLATISGVTIYSLQVGKAAREIQEIQSALPIIDACSQNSDFAETAAFIAGLDLVISVDTAVAHLAGALGIPVWILLPHIQADWRWLRNRDDSPWYPSAKIFRQITPGDWASTVGSIVEKLTDLLDAQTLKRMILLP